MNERGRNESDISRYTDVEYSPEGYKTVYRWGDFLEIAGGHVYNAMDTIDLVSTGGEYEGFNPRYAYTCEFVGCSTLVDGIALFRPVSRDGEDLTQIAFLRSDTSDEKTYRWSDFLEIAGGDARYAAMLIERTAPGEPQEGLHPETLVDQDIRDGEAFMLAGRPIAPEDIYDLPGTVHGLYSELVDNVGRSGTLARDWRGFSAGTDADDVLREIDGAFGETEYSRAGTVLGAYADDTFMSPFFAADDAARDVTPLTPWEDENGVAFLSRTFDADAAAVVPCLWYCRRDEGQGFEVGGVKLDCSKIGFDEVSNEAASNGFDCVLAYLEQSISGSEPLCDIAVRRADAGRADAVKHFGRQDEALAMLSAIAGCRIEAYGVDTLTYRALLDNAAAAKLAAGAFALKEQLSGRGDAVERGHRL